MLANFRCPLNQHIKATQPRLLPTSVHFPRFASTIPYEEYDYIVVGAGTAGSLLGNRLSADPKKKVLVLEAGPSDYFPLIHVPLGYLYTMTHPLTSWGFRTTDQPGLNGKFLRYPRGRVLGGCSSINGMIYQRGQHRDYDGWCRSIQHEQEGDHTTNPDISSEWSADDMEKYFDQHLDYADELLNDHTNNPDDNDNDIKWKRLQGGEWHVEKQRLSWDILDDFKHAAIENGFPEIKHFNNSNAKGCGYFQVNQNSGIRLSAYRAFLKPVMDRPNLDICPNVHVEKLLISNHNEIENNEIFREQMNRISSDPGHRTSWPKDCNGQTQDCIGVYIQDKSCPNGMRLIKVKSEVILTAGAIGSPHILECSGVGNSALLTERGVQGRVNLPGVGENLQALFNQSMMAQVMLGAEYMLRRTGPLSMAPSQFGLFAHSGVDNYHGTEQEENEKEDTLTPNTPDLQFHVQPLSLDDLSDPDSLHKFPGFTTSVCNLRPTSRGSVHLTAPSSHSAPDIDPQYLSTERDCLVAASALRLARKLVLDSPSFAKKYTPSEYKPGLHISTDKELAEAAGNISSSIFHPIGTCRLGKTCSNNGNGKFVEVDEYGVVDYQLKVRGVRGVRVCDASIMPTITSGNTNSPILAIAEKAAHMILNK